MKIRKQVYELTLADLAQFPVWEFALDEEGEEGQDEATVRPFQYSPPLNPNDGMFIVQAKFELADGTVQQGYLTPPAQGQNNIETIQPIILTEHGQVDLWFGMREPDSETITKNYQSLGKEAKQVFPIKFKSAVEILGDSVEGTVDGFMFYKIQGNNFADRAIESRN